MVVLLLLAGCSASPGMGAGDAGATGAGMAVTDGESGAPAGAGRETDPRDAAGVDEQMDAPTPLPPLSDGALPITGPCAAPLTYDAGPRDYWFAPGELTVPAGHRVEPVLCGPYGQLPLFLGGGWGVISSAPGIVAVPDLQTLAFVAVNPGDATISARYAGKAGWEANLKVHVVAADLVGIELAPLPAPLLLYGASRLQVSARHPDGSSTDVSAFTRFVSADPTVAVVAGVLGPGGGPPSRVVGLRPGKTEIQATYGGAQTNGPVEVTTSLSDAMVSVFPTEWQGLVGTSQDGVVPAVQLQSPSTGWVSLAGLPWVATPGGILGEQDGTFWCTAMGQGTLSLPLYDRTLSIPFRCDTSDQATALTITPADPLVLKVGESQLLSAHATFPGGSDAVVQAQWSVDDPSIAAFQGTEGQIVALKRGATKVIARYGGLTASITVAVIEP